MLKDQNNGTGLGENVAKTVATQAGTAAAAKVTEKAGKKAQKAAAVANQAMSYGSTAQQASNLLSNKSTNKPSSTATSSAHSETTNKPVSNADAIAANQVFGVAHLVKLSIFVEGKEIPHFKSFQLSQNAVSHHSFSLVLSFDSLGAPQNHEMTDAQKLLGKSITVTTAYKNIEGGPYPPDWGSIVKTMVVGFGFGALMKGAGKVVRKMKNLNKKASKLMSGVDDVAEEVIDDLKISNKTPKKAKPPFKNNPKHNSAEFNKQLKDQQDAINNMKTKEWLQNREDFKNRNKADYNKKAKEARDNYRQQELTKRTNEYMNSPHDMELPDAKKAAQQSMKGQAALHNPDGVAGGEVDQITGMGDSGVNSSIGSQWSKGRAQSIEDQIKLDYGIPPKTINDIPDNAMMNVDLF